MAAIDKISVNSYREFCEFYNWCVKFNDMCLKEINCSLLDYFYITPYEPNEDYDYEYNGVSFPIGLTIANFPEAIDKWLYKHCSVSFVRKRLKEQYRDGIKGVRERDIKLYIDR